MLPQRQRAARRRRHGNTTGRATGTILIMPLHTDDWPYPSWIAHRGAGRLAPENTLAAFELGWQHGWRMFECDVKLSADGVPFLLHDATLDRTTDGIGLAGAQPWSTLATLDAGSWHSQAHAGEPLPRLSTLAQWCLARGAVLNLEIKPSPGTAQATGVGVARAVRQLWGAQGAGQAGGPAWPLLTSFDPSALDAARQCAPELPRGLLLSEIWPGAWDAASALGVTAVVAHHTLWTPERLQWAQQLGWRTLAYTVNDADDANRLQAWGIDGLISDRIDLLGPGSLSHGGDTAPRPCP